MLRHPDPVSEPLLSRRSRPVSWWGSGAGRTAVLLTGGLLFVLGLIAFVLFQSQLLFTKTAQIGEMQPGLVPRSDGGILLGALLASTGVALMLFAHSPRLLRDRIVPASVFTGALTFLIVLHFTIFVNAFLLPNARIAEITASFLFHDTANAIPVAVYLLALLTAALVLVVLLSAIALVAPGVWERQVLHPRNVEAHRTRIVLLGLFVLGTGAAFARQFFAYALTGDRFPPGGLLDLNVTVVYYLLAFALVLALLALAARTALLAWGDLRVSPSYNFRRSYRSVTHIEAGLWGVILLLNATLLLAGPTFQPNAGTDRVFAVNSKGVSIFFHLVAAMYVVHRWTSRRYLRFLRHHPSPPSAATGWDLLATVAVSVVAVWSLLALLLSFVDTTPLTRLAVRVVAVGALLPLFALRTGRHPLRRPTARTPGAPYILLAALTLSTLGGIMLWGIGNSVTTRYVESTGFVTTTDGLAAYGLAMRWLGALFLAFPVVLGLRSLATRHRPRVHPAPLLVVGLSILLAMNLMLAITPTSLHPEAGRTDVVIGFNHVRLIGADSAALLAIGAATAAVGFAAAALLVRRGATEPPSRGTPTAVPERWEMEKSRRKTPQNARQPWIGLRG